MKKEGFEKAIVLQAKLEFLGNLGFLSEQSFKDNYEIISAIEPQAVKFYEEESKQAKMAVEKSYGDLKNIYDNNYQLCEQPLDDNHSTLEKNSLTHLKIKYFLRCLDHYSVKNSKKRLIVIAELQDVFCLSNDSKKECIANGFKKLSENDITPDSHFVIAAALRSIFTSHKYHLRKEFGTQNRLVSSSVFKPIEKSFIEFNNDNYTKSITILEKALRLPKLTAFDISYINRFLGNMYAIREEVGDQLIAIEYLNKALVNDELGYSDHWEAYKLLNDLYFATKQYGKYINSIGNYIYNNQKQFDLLPKETVLAINQAITVS